MTKIFLSHSSSDKSKLVLPVYNKLCKQIGSQHVIIDQFSFEEGRKTEEEIIEKIEQSDLIALFISEEALNSEWFQKEFALAKKMNIEKKCQICPLIISEGIKYDDTRIPNWLQDEYNIQKILFPRKISDLLTERYIEVITEKYPKTAQLKDLFVGRNEFLAKLEERLDSLDAPCPKAIFVSGINGVGRKTFICHGVKKGSLVKESYIFPEIAITYKESIEDFILKLSDLELSSPIDFTELTKISLQEKKQILIKIIKSFQDNHVFIVVRDDGCLINHNAELSEWFYDTITSPELADSVVFLITSRFKYIKNKHFDSVYFDMSLPELTKSEREGLLNRLLTIEKIEISTDDKKSIANLLNGYPKQVQFAVRMLKELGIENFDRQRYRIIDFGKQNAALLLKDIEPSSIEMQVLIVLSKFDYIDKKVLRSIFNNVEIVNIIDNFYLQGICEYLGTSEEYIRMNDIVKDYIIRGGYSLPAELGNKINQIASETITSMKDNDEISIPQILFSIKQNMLNRQKIPTQYLIPSIYLSTISELYYDKKFNDVIKLADLSLEHKDLMDVNIVFEIRYLLCESLAQIKSDRFIKEVREIKGADHNFLFGFYYRKLGKYKDALERYNECLKQIPNHKKAKREKVQTLIGMQDYAAALDLAENNYESNKDNPYHIQAYFNCIIRGNDFKKKQELLQQLINDIEIIQTANAKQMTLTMKAQFEAFINSNKGQSIMLIDEAISSNRNLPYAQITKFDIAVHFDDIELMTSAYNLFCSTNVENKFYNSNAVYMKSVLILFTEKNIDKAKQYFIDNVRNYTEEAKRLVLSKLEKIIIL